ncbi:Protoheme ferro-lyase (ferrochelatase) (HemH) (PDB:1AK1) [Commensalibacter communis]|uniref:Ferrochelatase n=1 Tax=Commensalibacter communis TaxID=2972786 RepID=A0A9W4XAB5_9PROT|nr:ferrochelatase [Commensalibacter communis]CAI3949290.1 Protoheme ferro-lyase (ferrochelatase) (HemH) (PDB:1AK1) [Commensalibacter communis]CAI3950596.1 Protoheme ferro-lyase (ferrochelatase) (HemH) (PDB:1AK1) [Commensalibacter communis]CAI3952414.1 Protoheme ferro-lyase (ferrochelatase) (HemH) (PDB:1AK1) [Commensalibacter communis]CAI3953541.1 Protoheme ferro-lyase (ferrochelatase) (HemH) (PDB:1AK1) [Commensalibacter communis]
MNRNERHQRKIGVLLVNLGTPEGTDYWSIRRYLSEFLSDKRVIELSSLLWQPILQGFVLAFRPRRLGHSYKKIWDNVKNKSPLAVFTQNQAESLQIDFANQNICVEWAMRYGKPSIEKKLDFLIEQGCNHILILPLYPQYSATTTATVNDEVFRVLMSYRQQPAIRTLFSFPDHPDYIKALHHTIQEQLQSRAVQPERILLSFHGLPLRYVKAGDPYEQECQKTAAALRDAFGKTEQEMPLVYQSRFGPDKWLGPNIADVIKEYNKQGIQNIAVVAPGFMADCLETKEEINCEYRELFLSNGGKEFTYIPCLNDHPLAISLLKNIIQQEIKGWI